MLVLTHGAPANDAERRVFAILHGFGAGAARRRGVAILGNGFDQFGPVAGLLCTPEALVVLAACEVSGGEGYLFAPLRAPWTIGGRTVEIADIGANPVYEIDVAVKRIVAQVRRGGVDPGSVQSLVAVDGAISGVAQPETERGQGIVVAPTQPDAFIEGINRASVSRDAGLSTTWTTADVLGVVSALGFDAAEVDVELLTGEGFPYSPYVLRPTSMDDVPFSRDEPAPRGALPLRSHAPTLESTEPSAAVGDQRDTGPIPAVTPPLDAPSTSIHSMLAPPTSPPPVAGEAEPDPDEQSSGKVWRWLVPVAALLVIGVGVFFGASSLFGGSEDESADPGPSRSGAASSEPEPPAGVQSVAGYDFEAGPSDVQSECAAHAYGKVKEYLQEHPCVEMKRSLFLTEVDGKPVALSVVDVTMPDADAAAGLKVVTDTDGTGNVNDLLRDGDAPKGYPTSEVIIGGEYASSVAESSLRIVEAAFVDGSKTTPKVDAAADAALQLEI